MRHLPFAIALICVPPAFGQLVVDETAADHGRGHYSPEHTECITAAQRAYIQEQISTNRAALQAQGALPYSSHAPTPLFNWPLRAAAGFTDPGYHGISNYVDHNPAVTNQLLDYNCGTRTYDQSSGYNHAGTDIYTWPWSWYKMDFNHVEVIAATPGTIVFKQDGNYDRQCGFGSGNWNAVYVQHNDGSVAWYGHMKNGSLTSKTVGQTVAQGEYLGVVGSSGNSTGPHLHLEVYNSTNQLIDPWAGTCNPTTATSWWAAQRPYYDPAVNALRTQSAPTNFGSCPAQEIINDRLSFCPNNTVYFTAYYRDQLNGQVSTSTVRRPDNSVFQTWNTTSGQYYSSSWWWNSYTLPSNAPTGRWTYEVTLNSVTTRHYFHVGTQTPTITAASSTTICAGDSVRLTVPRAIGHTYAWRLNGNAIANATDTVYWAKAAGNFTCAATSFCATNTSAVTTVTVNAAPTTPTVQQVGISLYTDPVANHTHQWLLNAAPIIGQTGNTHITTVDGAYRVRITAPGGCSSLSNTFTMTTVLAPVRVFLEGPLNTTTLQMDDALRLSPTFPLSDPYPGLGYAHTAVLASAPTTPAALSVAGNNAPVDWVVVEVRSSANNTQVLASRTGLVQRDGDVVEADGTSPLRFGVAATNHFVAVRHRNHLAAMSASAIGLSGATGLIDFTAPAFNTYGTDARKTVSTSRALWAGNVNFNNNLQYVGNGNDRDPILTLVGGTTPNNTITGYHTADVNLNGTVQYIGAGNDRDPILVNVGSTTPNNVRVQQLP